MVGPPFWSMNFSANIEGPRKIMTLMSPIIPYLEPYPGKSISTTFHLRYCSVAAGNSAVCPSFQPDVHYLILSLCWNFKLWLNYEDYGQLLLRSLQGKSRQLARLSVQSKFSVARLMLRLHVAGYFHKWTFQPLRFQK